MVSSELFLWYWKRSKKANKNREQFENLTNWIGVKWLVLSRWFLECRPSIERRNDLSYQEWQSKSRSVTKNVQWHLEFGTTQRKIMKVITMRSRSITTTFTYDDDQKLIQRIRSSAIWNSAEMAYGYIASRLASDNFWINVRIISILYHIS